MYAMYANSPNSKMYRYVKDIYTDNCSIDSNGILFIERMNSLNEIEVGTILLTKDKITFNRW